MALEPKSQAPAATPQGPYRLSSALPVVRVPAAAADLHPRLPRAANRDAAGVAHVTLAIFGDDAHPEPATIADPRRRAQSGRPARAASANLAIGGGRNDVG